MVLRQIKTIPKAGCFSVQGLEYNEQCELCKKLSCGQSPYSNNFLKISFKGTHHVSVKIELWVSPAMILKWEK